MPWQFKSAAQHGNKGVSITIEDPDAEADQHLFYGFPMSPGQTAQQFRAAVRREVRAHLNALNDSTQQTDVSDQYDDL